MSHPEKNKNVKSFLVINPYGIGDVLFTTPLIRNLKNNYPDAKIYYLCNKRTEFILKNNPLIEKIFVYDRDKLMEIYRRSKISWLTEFIRFIGEIRREKIEISFDFSLNTYFGFIAFLSGIKYRLGLDYRKRGVFLNRKLPVGSFCKKHVAEYYLDLLNEFGIVAQASGLEVYTDSQSIKWADNFIIKNKISGLIISVAPMGGESWGSKAYLKRWPAQKFSRLIDELIDEFNAKIFLFAGENEKQEIMSIKNLLRNSDNCFDFAGCSFEKVIALIDRSSLFIGNDTGLLRFADALKKKIIAFFGPVDENVYGMFPFYPDRHVYMTSNISCRPCYKNFRLNECSRDVECLKGISVDDAMMIARKFINTEVKL